MMHFYLRAALLVCLVFVVPMVLIHAQPYDDQPIRVLLMPDGCKMPCFMGIKPGLTKVDEAMKILHASGWVDRMQVRTRIDMSGIRLDWMWNGLQPAIFDEKTQVTLRAEAYETFNSYQALESHAIVESITIRTTIHYGDMHLMLGNGINRPNYVALKRYFNRQISAIYSDHALVAQSNLLPCPVSPAEFWTSSMELVIGYAQINPGGRIVCRKVA